MRTVDISYDRAVHGDLDEAIEKITSRFGAEWVSSGMFLAAEQRRDVQLEVEDDKAEALVAALKAALPLEDDDINLDEDE